MVFNGTSGQIAASAGITGPITVEFWYKSIGNAVQHPVFQSTGPVSSDRFDLYLQPIATGGRAAIYIQWANGTPADTAYGPAQINYGDGQWHHWVMILSGTQFLPYFDGVLDTFGIFTLPKSFAGQTTGVLLGHDTLFTTSCDGSLDDVAIYPVALTPTQVSAHYSAGKSGSYPVTIPSIPIGPVVPVLAGQVYALPAIPVTLTASTTAQTSITSGGPYTNVSNGLIDGCFLKCASNSNVSLKKYILTT
jgi:hypothetical protein